MSPLPPTTSTLMLSMNALRRHRVRAQQEPNGNWGRRSRLVRCGLRPTCKPMPHNVPYDKYGLGFEVPICPPVVLSEDELQSMIGYLEAL